MKKNPTKIKAKPKSKAKVKSKIKVKARTNPKQEQSEYDYKAKPIVGEFDNACYEGLCSYDHDYHVWIANNNHRFLADAMDKKSKDGLLKTMKRDNAMRMLNMLTDGRMPTRTQDGYWIWAAPNGGRNDIETHNPKDDDDHSGKWLIFGNKTNIDSTWKIIRDAVVNSDLAYSAKCVTSKPSRYNSGSNGNPFVICVYCYKSEAMKVREELHKLGITNKIPWKADQATRDNKYAHNTKEKVSELYC